MIVREYEKIFADKCPNFDELIKFAQASEFLSLGWQFVQAKNYVGVIELPSGFQLEILPKIYEGGDEIKLRGLVVEMIFAAYDEYSLDRPEHRLIKATLIKILRTTRENFRGLRRRTHKKNFLRPIHCANAGQRKIFILRAARLCTQARYFSAKLNKLF